MNSTELIKLLATWTEALIVISEGVERFKEIVETARAEGREIEDTELATLAEERQQAISDLLDKLT